MPTVIPHATASLLLERGSDFLLRSEVENNLILGICGDFAGNPPVKDKQPWLMTIEENEAVIGIAIVMNPPRNMIVTRMSEVAMTSLVEFLVELKLVIHGAVGPSPDVAVMAELWAQKNGLRVSLSMNQTRSISRSVTSQCVTARCGNSNDRDFEVPQCEPRWVTVRPIKYVRLSSLTRAQVEFFMSELSVFVTEIAVRSAFRFRAHVSAWKG